MCYDSAMCGSFPGPGPNSSQGFRSLALSGAYRTFWDVLIFLVSQKGDYSHPPQTLIFDLILTEPRTCATHAPAASLVMRRRRNLPGFEAERPNVGSAQRRSGKYGRQIRLK